MKKLLTIIIGLGLICVGFSETTNAPSSSTSQSTHLSTRIYKAETFFTNLKKQMPPQQGETDQQLVLRYFKLNQIEIEKTGAVYVNDRKRELYVRTSPATQDKVETLIAKVQTEH